jgi:hypothetical protein
MSARGNEADMSDVERGGAMSEMDIPIKGGVLRPLTSTPEREWELWRNPGLRHSLAMGLADSAEGRVHDLGSFSEFSTEDGPAEGGGVSAERTDLGQIVAWIDTHNDVPVTPTTLRFAATHEAMNRSWIFDVLVGLADLIEASDAARVALTTPTPESGTDEGGAS